jgi:L-alanine-DL-glutamate epimerase-like enolase superfamily enzyme
VDQASRALVGDAGADGPAALAERLRDVIPAAAATRAGIEQAWWDAAARSAGAPLFRRVGGSAGASAPAPVTTDITIPICAVERAAALAAHWRALGFDTLKLKVGARGDDDEIARVLAIVGAHPEAALVLDANEGWTVEQALDAVRTVRARGGRVAMLEQPVPRADLDALARLTREVGEGTLVAADEACRSTADVEHIGKNRLASAVNVKIAKCGVHEALAMLAAARRHGLQTMIGAMVETRLGTGFSAHVVAGLGGFAVVDLDTSLLLAHDPIAGGPTLDGPRWRIDPAVPGHGGGPRGARSEQR